MHVVTSPVSERWFLRFTEDHTHCGLNKSTFICSSVCGFHRSSREQLATNYRIFPSILFCFGYDGGGGGIKAYLTFHTSAQLARAPPP